MNDAFATWFMCVADPGNADPAATPIVGAAAAVQPWHQPQVRAFGEAFHAAVFHAGVPAPATAAALNGAAVLTPPEWQYVAEHVYVVPLYAPPSWFSAAVSAVVEKFTVCVPRTWFAWPVIVVLVPFATTCEWHSSHVYVVYTSRWMLCRADSPVLLTAAVFEWHDVHSSVVAGPFHVNAGVLFAPPTGAAFEWQ
jgi:hypothetical protein